MSIEEIILDKSEKYYCDFDEHQKQAISEMMMTYAGFFSKVEMNNKAIFIISNVGKYFCLQEDWHKIYNKYGDIVTARQIAMYFMKMFTRLTLDEIAGFFDKKHDNAIWSIKKVKIYAETDKVYAAKLLELEFIIKSNM